MSEVWKEIPRFGGQYEASSKGRIRQLFNGGEDGWRVMKTSVHGSYEVITITLKSRAIGRRHRKGDHKPGTTKQYKVHRLVLEAFVGPCPKGMMACHNNSNPLDNRPENLRWDTWEANCADMVEHGTRKGSNNGRTSLLEDHVEQIKYLIGTTTAKEVAKQYGVSNVAVGLIKNGKTWTHVSDVAPSAKEMLDDFRRWKERGHISILLDILNNVPRQQRRCSVLAESLKRSSVMQDFEVVCAEQGVILPKSLTNPSAIRNGERYAHTVSILDRVLEGESEWFDALHLLWKTSRQAVEDYS